MTTRFGHEARSVAEYILWLARNNPITPMQLLKLVYLCHGWRLGLYSKPLIASSVEAWKYGPVVPSVYHAYKKFGGNFISAPRTEPSDDFRPTELRVMTQVWDGYGLYTGPQLSALTHKPGSPWDITRRLSGLGSVISNDLIEEHYRRLAQEPQ